MTDDEDGFICGESYDHDLTLIDESNGARTYMCEICGAELWEDEDEDELAPESYSQDPGLALPVRDSDDRGDSSPSAV